MNKYDYDYDHNALVVRRREEVAFPFFQGYSIKEIVEFSIYSEKTIRKDIKYIENHPEEFLG